MLMGLSPVLAISTQSGNAPVSSGNALRLEDIASVMRRFVSPLETAASSTSVPETLAAGVCAIFGAKKIIATTNTLSVISSGSVPRWGLTRLMALRFLRGGLVFFIRLERMNELPFKFRQNGLFQYIINRAQTEE